MHRGARGGDFSGRKGKKRGLCRGGGGGRFKIDARATASRTAGPSLRAETPRLASGGAGGCEAGSVSRFFGVVPGGRATLVLGGTYYDS